MMTVLFAVHIVVCALLIIIILIQAGRGGGLVEGFSGVESMFGPKTNVFLTRATSIFSVFFFVSCIGLALLSARQSRSLLTDVKEDKPEQGSSLSAQPPAAVNQTQEVNTEQIPQNKAP